MWRHTSAGGPILYTLRRGCTDPDYAFAAPDQDSSGAASRTLGTSTAFAGCAEGAGEAGNPG